MFTFVEPDMRGEVVVVTGASAGVGRAAAELFARCGASLALFARDPAALDEARGDVERYGVRAMTVPLDVADADAVFAAAEAVERELGPIGIWVNNAMATVFSTVADLEPEEVRRVTEVTYLGTVHGTMAALRCMRPRDRGTIVQVGSALAYRGIPLQAPYCGAKHAIRGFTDSLRAELMWEGNRIKLSAVHLPAVNTPQFDWARTKRPKKPRPVAPVYSAHAAAEAVVHAAAHPQREYWIGGRTLPMIMGNMIVPQVLDYILARQAVGGQAREEALDPERRDNLFEPVRGLHARDGSFGEEARRQAARVPAPAGRLAVVMAAGLLASALAAAGAARLARRSKAGAD